MTRRPLGLLIPLALSLLAVALPCAAQPQGKLWRIGFLSPTPPPPNRASILILEAFRQGMRELGYVEGHNIVMEYRWGEGTLNRLPDQVAELVQRKVDVIVAIGGPGARAAKQATTTIPIVLAGVADPVRSGLIASLARPGGNITGVTYTPGPEIYGKALQFFKEAVPGLTRVAVLLSEGDKKSFSAVLQQTADALGFTLLLLDVWPGPEVNWLQRPQTCPGHPCRGTRQWPRRLCEPSDRALRGRHLGVRDHAPAADAVSNGGECESWWPALLLYRLGSSVPPYRDLRGQGPERRQPW